ncbi:nitrilase-related carbon-nitrogen hydrolase [Schinkia azotoformans]|uniref:nitrilase-related carbon-nitrogen hydrolase n=1 Tax=Schinkia azotoformans TaxID=1454 RepID=UPI002DBDDEDD|nr:nitrilase-related carbon-nitrogen hydrolase [Schinkia azotoformans]MEC1716944.1 nitrilase-related carbon-nitrogen hydrolase [Schinkia azotoformans]
MNTKNNSFKVACIQFNPVLNEREKNIKALFAVIEEAAQQGAKLIITPEMATTGYYYKDRKAIASFVDLIPGHTTAFFESLAKSYKTFIVIGMPEQDSETGLYYNSAALIGPDGYIGKYRKIHLWESEAHWAAIGDLGVPVFETEIGNIAINICMDSVFFESARLAAVQGANILAFPTNSSSQTISLLQDRAETNGLYVVSANRSNCENGHHMVGASAIWSPLGEKVAEAPYIPTPEQSVHEPLILFGTINKDLYQNPGKERLRERRPENYRELMLYIAPWDFTKSTVTEKITAAIFQTEIVPLDKKQNLAKHKQLIEETVTNLRQKGNKLDLVVFPELAMTGTVAGIPIEEIMGLAETVNDIFIKQYRDLAKRWNIHIVLGFLEKEKSLLYNSAIVIDEFGEVIGHYRKIHLNEEEKRWATPGEKIEVFDTNSIGRIGIMIGNDAAFPEVSGILAVKRADTIIIPSNWYGEFGKEREINKNVSVHLYPEGALTTWDAIALGNQAYVLVANSIKKEGTVGGRSGMYTIDPLYGLDQPVIAANNNEESLIVNYETLQSDWWINQEKVIALRQTRDYKPLVLF